jgi:DNA-binding response OmpR family regulator
VVDDDRDLCDNLWDLLRDRGYRVHLAHDIPEAEKVFREPRAFQVVLIDMKLPAGDGNQVLRLLQKHHQEARAVLITGRTAEMEAKVHEALQAGANAVCYKPFNVDQLLSTINELSARKTQSS